MATSVRVDRSHDGNSWLPFLTYFNFFRSTFLCSSSLIVTDKFVTHYRNMHVPSVLEVEECLDQRCAPP